MDLTKLNDADLIALQAGDLSKVSDDGLQLLNNQPATEVRREETQQEPAPNWAMENIIKPVVGAATVGADYAAKHPVAATALGYGAYNLASKIPGVGAAANALGETFIPKYGMAKNIMQGAGNWAEQFAHRNVGNQAQAMADLAHQARMSGNPLPSQMLHETAQNLQQKMGGAPVATGPVSPGQQVFDKMANQLGSSATAETAPQLGRYAQMAQRVAPFIEGASKALAPAMIAKELFYTSPEEVEQLKQMRQNGTSLRDWGNQKYQQINELMRSLAAQKAIGQ